MTGMCGGCYQALLKLALLHLGGVCPCSQTRKRLANCSSHDLEEALSTVGYPLNQFMQAAKMLSSIMRAIIKETIKNELL